MTEPVSGRSSPAITMSSVDLPEPEGPMSPIASPPPICRSMSLRICTRVAPRPSDRLMPLSAIARAPAPNPEVSCMPRSRSSFVWKFVPKWLISNPFSFLPRNGAPAALARRGAPRGSEEGGLELAGLKAPASYGLRRASVQVARGVLCTLLLMGGLLSLSAPPAAAEDHPVRIVALGDSLTAGLGLPRDQAFPAKLAAALAAKGLMVEISNAG